MGQNSSSNSTLTDDVELFGEEVLRQAKLYTELATLSYNDFINCLRQINTLAHYCMDADGKQLMFIVKTGTDSSIFWRSTIRVACVKANPVTRKIYNFRMMNLNEFVKVYRALNNQYQTALQISNCKEVVEDRNEEACSMEFVRPPEVGAQQPSTSSEAHTFPSLTTSVVFREVDRVTSKQSTNSTNGEDQFVECCICLDRTPNIMLPCAHSYCKQCIEKWSVSHKTCPVCREEVKSSDDTWVVISEAPNSLEVNEEICSTLMNIIGDRNSREGDSSSGSSNDNIRQSILMDNYSLSNDTDVEDYDEDDGIHIV